MKNKQELQLELLKVRQQIRSCEQFNQVRFAWSIFWSQKATSQTNYARYVKDGTGRPYTDAEKEKDAIDTASRHIQFMEETLQKIHELHEKERDLVKLLLEHGEVNI